MQEVASQAQPAAGLRVMIRLLPRLDPELSSWWWQD
jgi:hypothetical protein